MGDPLYPQVGLLLPYRAFIYTLLRQKSANPTNLMIVMSAMFFTSINGYINAKFIIYREYSGTILEKTLMVLGIFLFAQGFVINYWADEILLKLRKPGDKGYYIPFGLPYHLVSCPNYLGEISEWVGLFIGFRTWAIASFVINTCFNLVPRAISTHKWYQDKFGEKYPRNRRAIIPFVW